MRTIADFMATELVTFTPETSIHYAIHILLQRRISGAPVVDESGKLVGVLTTRDCLKIVLSTSYHADRGGPVSEFMSAPVETLAPDLDLVSAAQHLLESRFRRFPVVRDGQLVGQISRCDILKAIHAGA